MFLVIASCCQNFCFTVLTPGQESRVVLCLANCSRKLSRPDVIELTWAHTAHEKLWFLRLFWNVYSFDTSSRLVWFLSSVVGGGEGVGVRYRTWDGRIIWFSTFWTVRDLLDKYNILKKTLEFFKKKIEWKKKCYPGQGWWRTMVGILLLLLLLYTYIYTYAGK